MNESQNEFQTLIQIDWLSAFGVPCDENRVCVIATPDEFFERIYQSPYENWCVEDQSAAEQLPPKFEETVKAIACHVYEIAWQKVPQPEFCALLYDDVYAIAALLIINDGVLHAFTQARLDWYQKGRVPCGYEGEFPDGVWFVI